MVLTSKKRHNEEINRAYDMGYHKAIEDRLREDREKEIFHSVDGLELRVKRLEEKMKCVCSGFCEDGESCKLDQNQSDKSFR